MMQADISVVRLRKNLGSASSAHDVRDDEPLMFEGLKLDTRKGRLTLQDTTYVELTPSMTRLLAALMLLKPGFVLSRHSAVKVLYDDREDGGPQDADRAVAPHMFHLRNRLKPLGYAVLNHYNYGWWLERAPLDEQKAP